MGADGEIDGEFARLLRRMNKSLRGLDEEFARLLRRSGLDEQVKLNSTLRGGNFV
jgi:hypothetical protein